MLAFQGWRAVFHRCGREPRVLGVHDLEPGEEVTWVDSSPALVQNGLFIRVGARLDCYRDQ